MSNDATKKRRVGDDDHIIDIGNAAAGTGGSTTVAALIAENHSMRNRMDEMETIDSMKSRILNWRIRIILWRDH